MTTIIKGFKVKATVAIDDIPVETEVCVDEIRTEATAAEYIESMSAMYTQLTSVLQLMQS